MAQNQPQPKQKMLIFRVIEARGFSQTPAGPAFEFSVGDKSSGVIPLQQFLREKFSLYEKNANEASSKRPTKTAQSLSTLLLISDRLREGLSSLSLLLGTERCTRGTTSFHSFKAEKANSVSTSR
jgi:hypothetical protein